MNLHFVHRVENERKWWNNPYGNAQIATRSQREHVLLDFLAPTPATGNCPLNLSNQHQEVNPGVEPISPSSGEQSTVLSIQPSIRADRIVAVCANCQATLSIRRVHLGKNVQCKQCEHIFLLRANDDLQPKPDEPVRQGASSRTVEHFDVERASRLKKEHERLLAEHVKLATELEQRGVELEAVRGELDRHVQQLGERDLALDAAHAEAHRLTVENQAMIEKIMALEATVAERDRTLSEQSDELLAQIESHQSALIHAEIVHREAIGRVEEDNRSMEMRYQRCEDRILELTGAHERLESEARLMLDGEQIKQNKLAEELVELRANSEETARLAEQLISANKTLSEARPAPDRGLEAAYAQIEELKQLLSDSERLNHDMADILANLGLRFNIPVGRS